MRSLVVREGAKTDRCVSIRTLPSQSSQAVIGRCWSRPSRSSGCQPGTSSSSRWPSSKSRSGTGRWSDTGGCNSLTHQSLLSAETDSFRLDSQFECSRTYSHQYQNSPLTMSATRWRDRLLPARAGGAGVVDRELDVLGDTVRPDGAQVRPDERRLQYTPGRDFPTSSRHNSGLSGSILVDIVS